MPKKASKPRDEVAAVSSEQLCSELRIKGALGKGAFAQVYLGTYKGETCAIKVLLPEHAQTGGVQQKLLLREGQYLSRCSHKNIVRCLAICQLPSNFPGLLYEYKQSTVWALVLEYVGGGSLAQAIMRQMCGQGAPYSNHQALGWMADVASALNYLHTSGLQAVIHRDLKPENVLLAVQEDGTTCAKLTDFGLMVAAEGRSALLRRRSLQPYERQSAASLAGSERSDQTGTGGGPGTAAAGGATGGTPVVGAGKIFYLLEELPAAAAALGSAASSRRASMDQHQQQPHLLAAAGAAAAGGASPTVPPVAHSAPVSRNSSLDGTTLLAAGAGAPLPPPAARPGSLGLRAGAPGVAPPLVPLHEDASYHASYHGSAAATASLNVRVEAAFKALQSPSAGAGSDTSGSGGCGGAGGAAVNQRPLDLHLAHGAVLPLSPAPAAAAAGQAAERASGDAAQRAAVGGSCAADLLAESGSASLHDELHHRAVMLEVGLAGHHRPAGHPAIGVCDSPLVSGTSPVAGASAGSVANNNLRPASLDLHPRSASASRCTLIETETGALVRVVSPMRASAECSDSMPCLAPNLAELAPSPERRSPTILGAPLASPSAPVPVPVPCRGPSRLQAAPPLDAASAQQQRPPSGAHHAAHHHPHHHLHGPSPDQRQQLLHHNSAPSSLLQLRVASAGAAGMSGIASAGSNTASGTPHRGSGSVSTLCSTPAAHSGVGGGSGYAGGATAAEGPGGPGPPSGTASALRTPVRTGSVSTMLYNQYERDFQLVWRLTGQTGSCFYMAPEVFRHQPYNEMVDVFSFGLLLYETIARSLLLITAFNTEKLKRMGVNSAELYAEAVAHGYRPPKPTRMPAPVWELVCRCWAEDPVERPTMEQVAAEVQRLARALGDEPTHTAPACKCAIC